MPSEYYWEKRQERNRRRRSADQVTVHETVAAPHNLANAVRHRMGEAWAVRDEGVELAAFATSIHPGRELGQKGGVEEPPSEGCRELRGIDADESRVDAQRDTALGEGFGRLTPEREARREPGPGKQSLAVAAHVSEKQVAEGKRFQTRVRALSRVQGAEECRLVGIVRTVGLERNLSERKCQCRGLGVEKRAAHSVDAHALEPARDAGEETNHFHGRIGTQRPEGKRAVLPAAPAEEYLLRPVYLRAHPYAGHGTILTLGQLASSLQIKAGGAGHRSLAGAHEQMSNPIDWRETRTPEEAAAETEEPAEASRLRSEDDAETRARQDKAEEGLREADRALEDGEARLRVTRAELQRREQELARTSDITREVARNAAHLLEQTNQIAEEARRKPPAGPPTESDS